MKLALFVFEVIVCKFTHVHDEEKVSLASLFILIYFVDYFCVQWVSYSVTNNQYILIS